MTIPDDTPQPAFADLDLDDRVLLALADAGYENPTPIQAATIPPMLAGRHVIGLAQTGTGKTAAFALPILSRIDLGRSGTQALILAPTRELALQVAEALTRYAHYLPGLHVLPIYGGQSYSVQLAGLRRGAHVVVGTPGRVIDHLQKKTLDLSGLRFLVLDEADEMLRMGFQEDVETILAETPEQKQVALFSATMPAQIRRISKKYLTDAVEITVEAKTLTAANTRQRYLQLNGGQKLDALTRILEVETFEAMIVFVRTKQATEDLAERLRARGFSAAAINGDLAQVQRERTIGQLRSGDLDILVATDVAARGLDVDRISHIVNYDIPHDSESYVHRIGRTGRAGRSGEALLFVTPRERHLLSSIERATRQPITEMSLPSVDDVNSQRVTKFGESITTRLDSAQLGLFRRLITDYVSEHEADLVDVAAALAVAAHDDQEFLLVPEPPAPERATRTAAKFDKSDRPERVYEPRDDGNRKHRSDDRDGDRGGRKSRNSVPMAMYRIAVGHRQKVQPGQIVGAIANEGGLSRSEFGRIDILVDHSLVELPAELPAAALAALARTRISGQLIGLTRDSSGSSKRPKHGPGAPPHSAKGKVKKSHH
jgi:ATP-dependent RNA helicase DeaD